MSRSATLVRGLGAVLLALLFASLPVGCTGGLFKSLMEGKNGAALAGSLKISPASASVVVGQSLRLVVTGGDGNYSFKVIGTGTFDAATMTYTAPGTEGADKVQVADGAGSTATVAISIKLSPSPDYRVAVTPAPTFPGPGAGGSAFAGSFRVENIATEAGAAPIAWNVYISRDTTLDSLDLLAASGTLGALGAAASSAAIAFGGTWPSAAMYYLIISVSAADDGDVANNQTTSTAIAVSAGTLPPPDYSVTAFAGVPSSPQVLSSFSGTIDIQNSAIAGSGAFPLGWWLYLSIDTTLDAGDQLIDTGSIPALASGATGTASFSGTFPALASTYYLIAKISSVDDAATGTKVLASNPIVVTGPRYTVSAVSVPASSGTIGMAGLNGSFTIQNTGSANGNAPIAWSVYASTNTTLDASDILIDSGSILAGLAAGASSSPNYLGNWPSVAGSYYIIASAQAADDATIGTLASTQVTAAGPTYAVSAVSAPASGTIGTAGLNGSFTVQNTGSGNGNAPIAWSVYASTNTTLDASDILIASGSNAAGLTVGAPFAVTLGYNGNWPSTAGSYYIIASVQASDDSNGPASAHSVQITVTAPPPPDYAISFNPPLSGSTGSALPGLSVGITNTVANPGSSPIAINLYFSSDQVLDASDIPIGSAQTPALAANASTTVPVPVATTWPITPGYYYLIATISAADDANPTNNTTVSHAAAVGTFSYTEGAEDNSGPMGGMLSPAASVTGATLTSTSSLAIEGTMDAVGTVDVFAFATDASVNTLNVQVRWLTGSDDMNLTVWDLNGTNLSSSSSVADAEPGLGTLAVPRPAGSPNWFAGVIFTSSVHAGQKYTILVTASP